MAQTPGNAGPASFPVISLRRALPVWIRIALSSFGGPAGQIAVMHRVLVDEERWISEQRILHALQLCTLLPVPRRSSWPPTSAG